MKVLDRLRDAPMISTLRGLNKTTKYAVLAEPFYGTAYYLFSPYHTLFMLSMGLTNQQLGYLTSIFTFSQFLCASVGGAIIDKLGRRLMLAIAEFLTWVVTLTVWAFSQNFWFFAVGVAFNGVMGLGITAWNCLLVEDMDPKNTINVFGMVYIAASMCAIVMPLGGLIVSAYGLENGMRVMYAVSACIMASKMLFLFNNSEETRYGKKRMEETRGVSVFTLLRGNIGVIKDIARTPRTVVAFFILLCSQLVMRINTDFFGTVVGQRLQIPEEMVAWFPFLKTVVMLVVTTAVIPRVSMTGFKRPLIIAVACVILDQALLTLPPIAPLFQLACAVLFEGIGMAMLQPMIDSLMSLNIDPNARARIMSVMRSLLYLVMVPFGSLAGLLSNIDTALPFVLNIVFLVVIILLAFALARYMAQASPWQEDNA